MEEKKLVPEIRFVGFDNELNKSRVGNSIVQKQSYYLPRFNETNEDTGLK